MEKTVAVLKVLGGFFLARFNERSTWAVLTPAIGGAIGVSIAPAQSDAIATVASALTVLGPMLIPDGKIRPKDEG